MLRALSPMSRRLLAAVALPLAAVWLIRWIYLPLIGRIRDRASQARDLRVKIQDARSLLNRLPDAQAAFQEALQAVEAARGRLIHDHAIAQALETLRATAAALHLSFRATQGPADSEAPGRFDPGLGLSPSRVQLTLALTGRYRQIGEFLARLPEAPFLSEITSLSITRQPDQAPALDATVHLTLYTRPDA